MMDEDDGGGASEPAQHTLYPRPDLLRRRPQPKAVGGRKWDVTRPLEEASLPVAQLRLGANRVAVVGLLGGSLAGKARLLGALADAALPQVTNAPPKV